AFAVGQQRTGGSGNQWKRRNPASLGTSVAFERPLARDMASCRAERMAGMVPLAGIFLRACECIGSVNRGVLDFLIARRSAMIRTRRGDSRRNRRQHQKDCKRTWHPQENGMRDDSLPETFQIRESSQPVS